MSVLGKNGGIIAHFTTVHSRTDVRIRGKQVASLSESLACPVWLFVQDGMGGEELEGGGRVVDTGRPNGGRLWRMTIGSLRMWKAVRAAKPAIAHFHDPELIPVGVMLKLSGSCVIYDVHENVPQQILGKHWISPWFRRPIAWMVGLVEWWAGRVFDRIVAATPSIAKRFDARKTTTVQNYPIQSELLAVEDAPYESRPPWFAYVGGMTVSRGAREMVQAVGKVPDGTVRLQLAGGFQPKFLQRDMEHEPGWERVRYLGWVTRRQLASVLGRSRAGLVLFHPTPNHVDAQPNKLFEYMAAGLPVIASDFPLWREIVLGAGCGILVDPQDCAAIAEAMRRVLEHPDEAAEMGRRGREAIGKKYNWASEAGKLVAVYGGILGVTGVQRSGSNG